ncbi:MAG: hypothetical protein ACK5ZV_01135 [bacterium]
MSTSTVSAAKSPVEGQAAQRPRAGLGRAAGRTGPARVVAAAQLGDAVWLALVSLADSAPGSRRLNIEKTERVAFTTGSIAERRAVAQAAARLRADSAVILVRGDKVLVRPIDAGIPVGIPDAQAAQTLGLLAEAEMPADFPSHRRAAGVLCLANRTPPSPTDAMSANSGGCTVMGWLGPADDLGLPVVSAWVPEPLALAGLARLASGADGARAIGLADGRTGVVTLLVDAGPAGVLARSRRDDPGEPDAAAPLTEFGDLVGVGLAPHLQLRSPPGPPNASALALAIDSPTGGLPSNLTPEAALVAGAAAAVLRADAIDRPLLAMTEHGPEQRRNPLYRAIEALSRPVWGFSAVAACVAGILLAPLAVNAGRVAILERHAAGLTDDGGALRAAADQTDFYGLLREHRWPVTALLADLAASAPAGLEIESLTLEHGKRVIVMGTTTSSDLPGSWRDTLNGSRVFEDARVTDNAGGRFQLNVAVKDALLAMGGRGSPSPVTVDRPVVTAGSGSGSTSGRDSARPGSSAGNTGRTNTGPAPATAPATPPKEPPSPISDAEIATLDRASAMKEWAARRAASQRTDLDQATRDRLAAEAAKAQQRMREAPQGGAK